MNKGVSGDRGNGMSSIHRVAHRIGNKITAVNRRSNLTFRRKFMNSRKKLGKAVVTGATAGLGRVYADRLAARGYDLLLVARRGDRLATIAGELHKAHGIEVQTLAADLAIPADVEKVAAAIGGDASITMLVNNAGTATMSAVASTSPAQMAAMVDLNVTAVAALTLAVLPGFRARNAGTIVNVGSVLGFATRPGISNFYSGTKAFVMHLTRGLQDELADTNIRVQLLLPAATATEIWQISGLQAPKTAMRAEDVVDAGLAGLDRGELVTIPSIADSDLGLLHTFDEKRLALYASTQTGKLAERYRASA